MSALGVDVQYSDLKQNTEFEFEFQLCHLL